MIEAMCLILSQAKPTPDICGPKHSRLTNSEERIAIYTYISNVRCILEVWMASAGWLVTWPQCFRKFAILAVATILKMINAGNKVCVR